MGGVGGWQIERQRQRETEAERKTREGEAEKEWKKWSGNRQSVRKKDMKAYSSSLQ